nr:MAG TPA: hypothetical protein [Caudoviricetes sp.]
MLKHICCSYLWFSKKNLHKNKKPLKSSKEWFA